MPISFLNESHSENTQVDQSLTLGIFKSVQDKNLNLFAYYYLSLKKKNLTYYSQQNLRLTYWYATADFNPSTAEEVWASKIDCTSSIIISLSRETSPSPSPLIPTLHNRFARTNDSLLSFPTVTAFCRLRFEAIFPTNHQIHKLAIFTCKHHSLIL